MKIEQFKRLVSRLEQQAAASPAVYRAKVAGLTLVGFGILAFLLSVVGAGLLLLAGSVLAMLMTGGAALLVLLKFGKLLFFLAVPLYFLITGSLKALFVRLPKPMGREINPAEAPALFAALDDMRRKMKGPRFHHVLVVDDLNATVVQRPAFGLIGWPRNYLLLGLPLLEGMAPQEALAVVAHEYGHLAGQHARFSAFIYRLRHTWGTIQAYSDQLQGWVAKLVRPLIRWYAPYFNAYTFVLARGDEYLADAASVRLVGPRHAMHALKRSALVSPRHQAFLQETFDRIAHEPKPPVDLARRWADRLETAPAEAEAEGWLAEALDREAHYADTHPTLRARLNAMGAESEEQKALPPRLEGPSAAKAWFGHLVETLRSEHQVQWAARIESPWAQKHAQWQQMRGRLVDLRSRFELSTDEQLETFKLVSTIEPETDQRGQLAAFNAAHASSPVPLALFLEGCAKLDWDDPAGLDLLEQAVALDAEATKAACEQAHKFLRKHGDEKKAEGYAERWRQRDAIEMLRSQQMEKIAPEDALAPHGAPAEALAGYKLRLADPTLRKHVGEVYLVRRVIPADPRVVQLILAVRLTRWGEFRGKAKEVVNRLANMDWPVNTAVVAMEQRFKPWRKKVRAFPDARIA
jgi:Zn-dependent protease with chaperone function